MRIRQVEIHEDKAEGDCCGFPYNTDLVSSAGVNIHFWVGGMHVEEILQEALGVARGNRDIVSATWSFGQPTQYWCHSDITRENHHE